MDEEFMILFSALLGAMNGTEQSATIAQLDDVESALDALPKPDEIVAAALEAPESLRFKVLVEGGHLEADVPTSMHQLVAHAMRDSLESRRAELLVQLSKESEANG